MSRLDELIAELCLDGVEYLLLEKVTSAINIRINPRKIFKLNPDDATCEQVFRDEIDKIIAEIEV